MSLFVFFSFSLNFFLLLSAWFRFWFCIILLSVHSLIVFPYIRHHYAPSFTLHQIWLIFLVVIVVASALLYLTPATDCHENDGCFSFNSKTLSFNWIGKGPVLAQLYTHIHKCMHTYTHLLIHILYISKHNLICMLSQFFKERSVWMRFLLPWIQVALATQYHSYLHTHTHKPVLCIVNS